MDDNPQELRAQAMRFYALALRIRGDAPGHANLLVEEAKELQDRAQAIEDAASVPPTTEAPAQLQEQVPPKEDDE